MRVPVVIALVLVAATLRADAPMGPGPDQIAALTPLDALPSPTALDIVFDNKTVENLQSIALSTDMTLDFGVQLRAIRALPDYCPALPAPCGVDPTQMTPPPDTVVHSTLLALLDGFNAIEVPMPRDLLRLRAAIEALGISGVSSALTYDEKKLEGFLNNTSRDVRATTAKALGTLSICTAKTALQTRFAAEQSAQVRLAISAALRDLAAVCP